MTLTLHCKYTADTDGCNIEPFNLCTDFNTIEWFHIGFLHIDFGVSKSRPDTKHCIVVFKENFKELYKTFYFKNSVLFTHIKLKIPVEFLKRQMTLNQRELCITPQSLWIRGNYSNWGHCKYIRIRKIWYPSKILQILTNEDIPLEIETGCNLQSFKCFI